MLRYNSASGRSDSSSEVWEVEVMKRCKLFADRFVQALATTHAGSQRLLATRDTHGKTCSRFIINMLQKRQRFRI